MKRLLSVLLWSVISAAFIGPGTVTAAASAGASFGYSLLWALLFSTGACLLLQEASARLTVVSGKNLGEALRSRYPSGCVGTLILGLVLGAIVVGCAAYEAGNILGGVAGAALVIPLSSRQLTVATVAVAAALLWFNSPRRIALALSALVAVMGGAFLFTAIRLAGEWSEILVSMFWPRMPEGSPLLAVALVGTTVVPYNLFLGSGLARGQVLSDLRFGLVIAIGLGGVISMAVLVVGAAMSSPLEFSSLGELLSERLGEWAGPLFSVGLFAAGLSSAVTAPLAAAVTARSLFSADEASDGCSMERRWDDRSWRFRSVWLGVLLVGLSFGLAGVSPIPVIILAQALNGILLPLVAVFLAIAVNDPRLMRGYTNGALHNLLTGAVVLVSLFLGLASIARAVSAAVGAGTPPTSLLLVGSLAAGVLVAFVVARARKGPVSTER